MNRHPSEILLSRYADGDLSDGEKKSLESHLRGCKKCKETLACLKEIKKLAETLVPVELPSGFLSGVKERISRETKTTVSGIWKGAILGVALSSAIALFAVLPHAVPPPDNTVKAAIKVSKEQAGPPVGLANSTSFGHENPTQIKAAADTQNVAVETHPAANLLQNADYKSEQQVSSSKYILVPIDDKARQDFYEQYKIELNPRKGSTYPSFVNLAESLDDGQIVRVKQDVLKQPARQP